MSTWVCVVERRWAAARRAQRVESKCSTQPRDSPPNSHSWQLRPARSPSPSCSCAWAWTAGSTGRPAAARRPARWPAGRRPSKTWWPLRARPQERCRAGRCPGSGSSRGRARTRGARPAARTRRASAWAGTALPWGEGRGASDGRRAAAAARRTAARAVAPDAVSWGGAGGPESAAAERLGGRGTGDERSFCQETAPKSAAGLCERRVVSARAWNGPNAALGWSQVPRRARAPPRGTTAVRRRSWACLVCSREPSRVPMLSDCMPRRAIVDSSV